MVHAFNLTQKAESGGRLPWLGQPGVPGHPGLHRRGKKVLVKVTHGHSSEATRLLCRVCFPLSISYFIPLFFLFSHHFPLKIQIYSLAILGASDRTRSQLGYRDGVHPQGARLSGGSTGVQFSCPSQLLEPTYITWLMALSLSQRQL